VVDGIFSDTLATTGCWDAAYALHVTRDLHDYRHKSCHGCASARSRVVSDFQALGISRRFSSRTMKRGNYKCLPWIVHGRLGSLVLRAAVLVHSRAVQLGNTAESDTAVAVYTCVQEDQGS